MGFGKGWLDAESPGSLEQAMPEGIAGLWLRSDPGGLLRLEEGQQGCVQTGCGPGVAQHPQGVCISVFSSLEGGLGMDGVNN